MLSDWRVSKIFDDNLKPGCLAVVTKKCANSQQLRTPLIDGKECDMSNSLHPITARLHQPETYLIQIHRLQTKLLMTNRLYETSQEDVSFYQFCMNDHKLAKILASTIKREQYMFQPATPKLIETKTKQRIIYNFCPTDRIVQFALHHCLAPYVKQLISTSVYSYIPGRSNFQAARHMAAQLKQYRAMYALRSDIVAYTDNIPTHSDSEIWQHFKQLLNIIGPEQEVSSYLWQLLTDSIRPVINDQNRHYQLAKGLPQGAPLTTIAANLYLQPIDNLLSTIPHGVYARFGDDLLFMHPEKNVLLETEDLLNQQLDKLGLYRNSNKDKYCYLTSNGRQEHTPSQFAASHGIQFLGYHINHNGSLSIAKHINSRLLKAIRKRIRNTCQLTKNTDLNLRGPQICGMLNHNLTSHDTLSEPRLKHYLDYCTDRQQLKQLDYLIALYLSQQLTGIQGVRAFRYISYKTIREQWGLKSLCQLRNQVKDRQHASA